MAESPRTFSTARLKLRPCREAYAAMSADPGVMRHIDFLGGPAVVWRHAG